MYAVALERSMSVTSATTWNILLSLTWFGDTSTAVVSGANLLYQGV